MATPSVTRIPATPASRVTIWAVGIYGLVQGAGLLAGGPQRWVGPSFSVVREIPGNTTTFGCVALVAGLLALLGSSLRSWHLKAAGLALLSAWSAAFAVGTLSATYMVPTAATTGGPTYMLVGVLAAILITIDESSARG